jgi:hypothetical protein
MQDRRKVFLVNVPAPDRARIHQAGYILISRRIKLPALLIKAVLLFMPIQAKEIGDRPALLPRPGAVIAISAGRTHCQKPEGMALHSEG